MPGGEKGLRRSRPGITSYHDTYVGFYGNSLRFRIDSCKLRYVFKLINFMSRENETLHSQYDHTRARRSGRAAVVMNSTRSQSFLHFSNSHSSEENQRLDKNSIPIPSPFHRPTASTCHFVSRVTPQALALPFLHQIPRDEAGSTVESLDALMHLRSVSTRV